MGALRFWLDCDHWRMNFCMAKFSTLAWFSSALTRLMLLRSVRRRWKKSWHRMPQ
jgi:hypothetical protein